MIAFGRAPRKSVCKSTAGFTITAPCCLPAIDHRILAPSGRMAGMRRLGYQPLENAIVTFSNLAKCGTKSRTARKITTCVAIFPSHPCDGAGASNKSTGSYPIFEAFFAQLLGMGAVLAIALSIRHAIGGIAAFLLNGFELYHYPRPRRIDIDDLLRYPIARDGLYRMP